MPLSIALVTLHSQRSTVNGRLTRHTFLARSFIPCLNFDAKETNVQTNILTKHRAIVNHKQFQVFYDHLHWCFIEKTLDQRSIRLLGKRVITIWGSHHWRHWRQWRQ